MWVCVSFPNDVFGFHFNAGTGRGGALAAFSGKGNIFVNDIPTSVPDKGQSARPKGTWAGPHCHRIPGIQGMPNAWLNQEFDEFLWPKNKWSWAQGMNSTGECSVFQLPECDPSRMLWFRTNGRRSQNSKGKCSITLGCGSSRAAVGIPWAGLAGTPQNPGDSSGSGGRALGKPCWWKENPHYRQLRGESAAGLAENTPRETPSEGGALSPPLKHKTKPHSEILTRNSVFGHWVNYLLQQLI